MGVNQPLKIQDALREALQDAQRLVDEYQLTAKIKIVPEAGPGGLSSVESSMDRTAQDAKDAAEKSISISGGGGGGPLNPSDKLVDGMERLIKAMTGVSDGLGKGKGRRVSAGASGGPSPLDEGDEGGGGGGYVNPYILQGLIQNPIGTTQNSLMGMLMGGAGMGLKAPSWLGSMLAGSSGMFKPGMALGAQAQVFGPGVGGLYANPALIAGSKLVVPVAAFAGTMALQASFAKDRMGDATEYIADQQFGRGFGMDWRGGTWGNNKWHSRHDIFYRGAQEVAQGMDVGLGSTRAAIGDWETATLLDKVTKSGMNFGANSGQMGSLLGAGVRSGSLTLNGGDSTGSVLRYLGMIEEWTRKGAENGLSTNEALHRFSELSQLGMQGTNILTPGAQRMLMGVDARIQAGMPDDLKRGGTRTAADALAADAQGETQSVLMMNQFLSADGNLNAEGEKAAELAFGKHQVESMKRQWGSFAPVQIAKKLIGTRVGKTQARTGMLRAVRGMGPAGLLAVGSGDALGDALAADASADGSLLDGGFSDASEGTFKTKEGLAGDESEELALAQFAQAVTRTSGLLGESARNILQFSNATLVATREMTAAADMLRMHPAKTMFGGPTLTLPGGGQVPNPFFKYENQR